MAFGDIAAAGDHFINDAGSVSTATTTVTWATTTGDTFVIGVRRGTDKGTTNTVEISFNSGSTWNTCTLAKDMPFQATDEYGAVYYYPNITGTLANATQIRITFDAARTMRYWGIEFVGNFAVHQTAGAQGNSASPDSGGGVTSVSCCIVGYVGTGANAVAATAPITMGTTNSITYTKRDENDSATPDVRLVSMDLNGAQAAGTYDALVTLNSGHTDPWTAIMVAFSNAGGAAGLPPGLGPAEHMQPPQTQLIGW